jgi:hypothetical protein
MLDGRFWPRLCAAVPEVEVEAVQPSDRRDRQQCFLRPSESYQNYDVRETEAGSYIAKDKRVPVSSLSSDTRN